MQYLHLIRNPKYWEVWQHAYGDELGRLAQGIHGRVQGTNTLFFIHKWDLSPDRCKDVMYGSICKNYRPEKKDPNRARLVMGGDKIHPLIDCGTPTVNLLVIQILLNSVISTPGARNMTIEINDFYLMTPMERFEYMRLKIANIPKNIIKLRSRVLHVQ